MVAFEGTLNNGSKIRVVAYIKSDNSLQAAVIIIDDETYHCNLRHEEIHILADTLSRACQKTAEQMAEAFEKIAAAIAKVAPLLDEMCEALPKAECRDLYLYRYDGPRPAELSAMTHRKFAEVWRIARMLRHNIIDNWKPNRRIDYG